MSNKKVGLIDYGAGNMRSVYKALSFLGADVTIITTPEKLNDFHSLVLPGVGAFADCSLSLRNQDLFQGVKDFTKTGKPFLGICVGYQILFEISEEFNSKEPGLSLFDGSVKKFPEKYGLKIPQIGWNQVSVMQKDCPLYSEIPDNSYFYFVHSYHPVPDDRTVVATTTDYGHKFASSVWKDNIMATQFHPEKSQRLGLKLLDNFLNID